MGRDCEGTIDSGKGRWKLDFLAALYQPSTPNRIHARIAVSCAAAFIEVLPSSCIIRKERP